MGQLELAGDVSLPAAGALLAAVALAAFLGGALLAGARRPGGKRAAAGALYALGALALAAALLGPASVRSSDRETLPRFAVLIDRSASMRERDLPGGRARFTLAPALLAEGSPLRLEIERRTRPAYLAFDSGTRALSPAELPAALSGPPAGAASDPVAALSSALEAPGVGPLAGILIITDGRATRGPPLGLRARALARRGVPVWAVGAGDPAVGARPRLEIAEFELPETAEIGEEVTADAAVGASGLAGRRLVVRLLLDGEEAGRRELHAPAGGGRLPVRFTLTPKARGVRRLELVAEAPSMKPAPRPARASRYLIVTGRPLRALYAEGRLGWGYREMAGSLGSAPGTRLELWRGFVVGELRKLKLAERLGRLDLVVLGDLGAERLGRKGLAALARAVREEGCGLLFAAGPRRAAGYARTPLAALLPVGLGYGEVTGAARQVKLAAGAGRPGPLRLDRSGEVDHRLWKSLPETGAAWKPGKLRPEAQVWLRAGAHPALVAWRAGQGRVAVLAWPDHWRWARSGADGAEGHRRLFARLAAWLAGRDRAGTGRLALSMTRYRLSPGEEVSLLARLLELPPKGGAVKLSAELSRAQGKERPARLRLAPVAPGSYRATVRAGEPGDYRLAVTARSPGAEWARAELFFSVESPRIEFENPAPDFAALRRLAAESGGAFLGPAEADRLPGLVAETLPAPRRRVRRTKRPLWDRPWLLALALAALCAAWIVLRRPPRASPGVDGADL